MLMKQLCWASVALLLVYFVILCRTAVAEEKELQLVLGTLPPFNCVDLSDKPRCVNNKLAAKLQHYGDINITVSVVPYARAIRMLQQNSADIMMLLQNDELADYAFPVLNLYTVNQALYATTDAAKQPQRRIRVGMLRGLGSNITSKLSGYQQIELADFDQAVEMLALGRLDAVLGPEEALHYLFQRHGLTERIASQPLLRFEQDIWLYCRHTACSAGQIKQLKLAAEQIAPHMPAILHIMPLSYYQ